MTPPENDMRAGLLDVSYPFAPPVSSSAWSRTQHLMIDLPSGMRWISWHSSASSTARFT